MRHAGPRGDRAACTLSTAARKLGLSSSDPPFQFPFFPEAEHQFAAVVFLRDDAHRAVDDVVERAGRVAGAEDIGAGGIATAVALGQETLQWVSGVTTDNNYAKQLALMSVGKTPVFYGGDLTSPVAYKWKTVWNTNAKNVAFWDEYPEFNHNGFIGWTSHPIEKPFAVFDLVSSFENPQILKRFTVSDRLLSGQRPKALTIELKGDSVIAQLLWGSILADFTSIYVAILNGVDPMPVPIVEKLKKELAD